MNLFVIAYVVADKQFVHFFATIVVKLVKFITTVVYGVAEVTVPTMRAIIFYCCCCFHAVAVKFIVTIVSVKFVKLFAVVELNYLFFSLHF